MTLNEWRKCHRLTHQEVAAILGILPQTSSNRGNVEASGALAAFLRVANTMPQISFGYEGGSYGQPVAFFNGRALAHGPADILRGDGRIAAHVVVVWATLPERTENEYQTAKRFLMYWPEGPHLR